MALDRQTEIRDIHRKYRTFYEIGGGFTIIALLILVDINLFASDLGGYSEMCTPRRSARSPV